MATHLPILTFHAVDDASSIISFPPRLFKRAMARLQESGYRTLSLPQVADQVHRGNTFTKKMFVLTFDDGYESVYQEAFPVLHRHGFSATVFLTVGKKDSRGSGGRLPYMGGRSMLSWAEIREMHRYGIEFGAHTLTHPDLTRLPHEQVESEIYDSKTIIENALGTPVASFAYPFGFYDNRCREIVAHHFACACSDRLGLVQASTDIYAMERVDAYYLRSETLIGLMPANFSLFSMYVRARAVPRLLRRAVESRVARRR